MVKNTTGGTGTKSIARKHIHSNSSILFPSSSLEIIACVTKPLGNGMLEVFTNDNTRLIAHIRNKFRGKQKRHNMINTFAIVLIGLREWEKPYKNCDILFVYDSSQIDILKTIPNISIDHVFKLSLGNTFTESSKAISNDITFTDEEPTETEKIVSSTVTSNIKIGGYTSKEEDIDFDDI